MAQYEVPSLYIDFSRLPPPTVIEEIDFEKLLQIYQTQVTDRLPVLKPAMALEQSPSNVILQAEAYGEMMVRARINAAARAVMLPFAVGADLDVLAAFYEEARDPVVANPRPYTTNPEDWESDERFRTKVQLSLEAFSTAGAPAAYVYHAMKADVTIRHASALRLDRQGTVKVTVMSGGSDPTPSAAQIAAVVERLHLPHIKPLTAVVRVAPPLVHRTAIRGEITLYPGPDQALVLSDIRGNLTKVRNRISKLGRDLTRAQLTAAINVEGVQNLRLDEPLVDQIADDDACVLVTDFDLRVATTRKE